jgi:hypothetical protein
MTQAKRPSTSSLRRFITSRPYVTVAEIRRRFALDADGVVRIRGERSTAYVGLPEREAAKLEELWARGEIGVEMSVEVRAPVVVGVFPTRVAPFVIEASREANGADHPETGRRPSPLPAPPPSREPKPDGVPTAVEAARPSKGRHRRRGSGQRGYPPRHER